MSPPPGMPAALLLGTALAADPGPLCSALLAERTDVAGAMAAIRAGVDVSTRCTHQVTVHVRRTPTLGEVLLGIVVPPVGVMMMLGNEPRPQQRTRHPAPLDLAVGAELAGVVDALLAAGADPLQPAPEGQPLPLVTAIGTDLRLGGSRWTDRLLAACDHVPAGLLRGDADALDALLGHPELLRPLLAKGLDPEGRDRSDRTWLSRAARDGDEARARAALALGADPNLRVGGTTPLAEAVSAGDLGLMALLVEAGADPRAAAGSGPGLVGRAVSQRDPAVLDAVLAMGLPVDGDGQGRAPLTIAAEQGAHTALARLLEAGARPTDAAVLALTKSGAAEPLRAVLAAGGDPDAEGPFGRRPLHHALRAEDAAVVAALLEAGADPGKRASSFVFDEPPPIHIPMERGDMEAVQRLLPRVASRERTWLLVFALAREDAGMATLIADSGADLDEVLVRMNGDGDGAARAWLRARGAKVPAHALADVVATGGAAAVGEALADGADPNPAPGPHRSTPAEAALERADLDVIALLVEAGARLPPTVRADRFVRDAPPELLDAALRMGAAADAGTIRDAVFWDESAALEVLARHVQDPEAWHPRHIGFGRLSERAEEIYDEKLAAERARKKAARAARRAARRARRGR